MLFLGISGFLSVACFFQLLFLLFFCDKGDGFIDAEMVYNCLIQLLLFFMSPQRVTKILHLKRENDVFLVQRENSHFREPRGMEMNAVWPRGHNMPSTLDHLGCWKLYRDNGMSSGQWDASFSPPESPNQLKKKNLYLLFFN